MEMIVVSDNEFYLAAFSQIKDCMLITPKVMFASADKLLTSTSERVFILSIGNVTVMLQVMEVLFKMKVKGIFIEPIMWPNHTRIFNVGNVYILPSKLRFPRLINTVKSCIISDRLVYKVNLSRVKGAEWNAMLYLMNGISSRKLALITHTSEKTISGRLRSLSCKIGFSGFNRATQLYRINLVYRIYILKKRSEMHQYAMRIVS